MPAMTAIIGANATQYKTVMGEVAAISERSAAATLASFKTVETQLKAQMLTVDAGTAQWEMYAASLASVQVAQAALVARATPISIGLAASTPMMGMAAMAAADPNIAALREAEVAAVVKAKAAEVAAVVAAEAEKLAVTRASQLAMLTIVAETGAVAGAFGRGGGPGGGISGVMREIFVIAREFLKGNWSRIPGSVVLLSQYMGLLGVVIKSTAQDAIFHAAAENKLAASMARTALAANAKLAAAQRAAGVTVVSMELQAAEAETADLAALAQTRRAEADMLAAAGESRSAEATAANLIALETERDLAIKAGVAQTLRAEAANTAAKIESAGATATIGVWGWVAAAVVVAGVAAYFTWRHFRNLAIETKNLADLMNPLKRHYEDEAKAREDAAKATQEQTDFLKEINDQHLKESVLLDRKLKVMREEAAAQRELMHLRGASATQLAAFDEAQLKRERDLLMVEKARMEGESETARKAEESAAAAFKAGARTPEGANLDDLKRRAAHAGEIRDAIQNKLDATEAYAALKLRQEGGGGNEPVTPAHEVMIPQYGVIKVPATETTVAEEIAKYEKNVSGAKVGNLPIPAMSVASAQKKYDDATAAAANLEMATIELADTLKDTKKTWKEKKDAILQYGEKLDEINDALGLSPLKAQIAALKGGGGRVDVTARERVGVGAPQIALLSVAQRQLNAQLDTNRILNRFRPHPGGRAQAVNRGESLTDIFGG